jgi:menaquinol-cytochrome c reductase iron-sulfur subunit
MVQMIGACSAFLGTLIGIPVVGAAVGPALKSAGQVWIDLGRADSFQSDVPRAVDFTIARRDGWLETREIKAVWVVRQADGGFLVFNGRCTHLGCAYHWEADSNQFVCPCHAGYFGRDGSVLSGPPPRGLDPLPTRVEGGVLRAQLIDFRLGVAEREPS